MWGGEGTYSKKFAGASHVEIMKTLMSNVIRSKRTFHKGLFEAYKETAAHEAHHKQMYNKNATMSMEFYVESFLSQQSWPNTIPRKANPNKEMGLTFLERETLPGSSCSASSAQKKNNSQQLFYS